MSPVEDSFAKDTHRHQLKFSDLSVAAEKIGELVSLAKDQIIDVELAHTELREEN